MSLPASPAPAAPGLDVARVLPVFVLVFVDVLGLTVILPLLHLYAAAYGASPAEIGLVAAAFPLAQLIGVPVMGALSDRFGRKPLLLLSQVSTCIGFLLLALAGSLEMILLARLIDGLFGANLATAQAALSDITDEQNRTRALGLTGAAFGLGFIFGPMIAILTLEMTANLMAPALSAAGYSFLSILLTLFIFKETLPPERRRTVAAGRGAVPLRLLQNPLLLLLLLLMFAQQLIFFGFESLMGLFTLSRLGLLGQANALLFLFIGLLLVLVQVRYIGRWSQRYGERRLVLLALALIGGGLLLFATTPAQPHPFYLQRNAAFDLRDQAQSATEAMIGDLEVPLPADGNNGVGGILWLLAALVPLSIGAGLIRPCLNSLMTQRVSPQQYGAVLGLSAGAVSAANAAAPLLGGVIFQAQGVAAPFLLGGVLMLALLALSGPALRHLPPGPARPPAPLPD
ncbi:MAG: MFS transporter [Anaerolineae bacterium]|nr:MFS transporter [Anaerolineae bacterium]